MRHASPPTLEQIADILNLARANPLAKEKSPGVFYIKGRAWLHFHEDPRGIFADIRPGDEWIRLRLFEIDEKSRLFTIICGA
jgi:hypothetical protein